MDRHSKYLLLFNIAMQFIIFIAFAIFNYYMLDNPKGANIMMALCGADVIIFSIIALFVKPKK